MNQPANRPTVIVVSDSAGETGEAAVKAAAVQFSPVKILIKRMPFIHDKEGIDHAVQEAQATGAVIVFTLVIPELRDYLLKQSVRHKVVCIDLLSPIISTLEGALKLQARHEPGMIHKLDEEYFRRVEAVEFAVKYDDGRDTTGIMKADIILTGVSRTSKTPLAMYLAHRKYKVANVPLVPELKPPKELFTISPDKIFGLSITPDKLIEIRRERLKALGLAEDARYANEERIRMELEYAAGIMKRLGCKVIDVSHKAVEETASIIMERMPLL